jgi:hypothetical protein
MSEWADRLRERRERASGVLHAPRVRIEVFGGESAHAVYRAFTARHPRFLVTAAKRWGVALAPLPDAFEDFVGGGSRKVLRQKRRLAEKAGFHYALVSPQERLDEIMEINRSAPERQGRPMEDGYLDREAVVRAFEGRGNVHGILDADGRLRAYALVLDIGDAIVFSMLLGHADDVEQGTMYLLVSEAIRASIEGRRPDGTPHWAMYDTFWGATKGLAYFKERVGFRQYTVDWVWVDRKPGSPSATGSGTP